MAADPSRTLIDWTQSTHSGRVELPDGHSLYLMASGPARKHSAVPAIIIEHGLGGSASEWVAVQRLLARFARVYVYERAGYHHSDPPPSEPTAQNIAADLRSLLRTAGVEPPYLLITPRTSLVIVDAAPIVTKVPPSWTTLLGDSTYEEIVGVNANRTLSDEEFQTMYRDSDLNSEIVAREAALQYEGCRTLKDRLDARPGILKGRLSVIFCDGSTDFRKVYEYGVKHGNGTEEAREALRKRLEDMSQVDEAAMREQLLLSNDSRFVKAEGKQKTHNVHIVDPDFVVREIEWVYEGMRSA